MPKVYPPVNDSMADLLKPLGQKENRGNVWIPIVNQIMNVQKDSTPPPSPSITPTSSLTPTPTPSTSPPPFDPDAAAYLAAVISNGGTGIDATVSAATETLFLDLKSNGLYSKMYAFYPMLGATSGSTSLNGIRSNSTYDLTYNGSFTYSVSGTTGDGLTGWANTNFNSNSFLQDNMSMGFYQFTQNTPTKSEEIIIGQSFGSIFPQAQIATRLGTARFMRFGSTTSVQQNAGGNYNGFYVASRTTSPAGYLYRNGNTTPTLSASTTYTVGGAARPIAVWNFYQDTGVYSNGYANQGLSFIFLGEGLSSSEVGTFSSIVNTFQTTLGRNTYITPSPSPTPSSTSTPTPTPSATSTPTPTPTPSPSLPSDAAISYVTWAETTSFSGLDVGGTGLVVVAVQGENSTGTGTINTVTLDGVAMTQATKSNYNGLLPQGIYYGENAGSTVDIVATYTGTNLRSGIAVWLITNYNSTTPEFVDGQTFGTATSRSVTTTSLSAGSVGVSALNNTVSASRTFTWTNATKVFDVGYSAATGEGTGADFSQSTSGARTITVSGLGNTGGNTFNTATWR